MTGRDPWPWILVLLVLAWAGIIVALIVLEGLR